MKRIINLLTVLVMAVSLAGVLPAMTASAETYEDYEYEILDDGIVEITGYTGSATELDIPSEIDGKAVTSIGNSAFSQCESLTSITIPDSVKGIKYCAFAGCTSLTSITIPNSVTSIEYSVFGATPWLENKRKENPLVIVNEILIDGSTCNGDVIIPDGVTNIAPEAFLRCFGITSVIIPDTVTSIGNLAFGHCGMLKNVIIGNSTESIGDGAFCGCVSIIVVPSSVNNIGNEAFDDRTIIKCYKDSYAEKYAIDNNIDYELLDGSGTTNSSQDQNNNSNNSSQSTTNNPNSFSQNTTTSPITNSINNKKTAPSTTKVTVTKPAKVKAVKLTAKKKKLNVKWKKISGATGYEVMYAKNNKFTKGKKTVKVKKNKITLKRLKSKKKYFVKVRAYKTVNGNTSYGKWSKTVKVKVK